MMFSRRPVVRLNRGRVGGAGLAWKPFGFGASLQLDLIAGAAYYDLGAGGDILRWHDQSGFGNHAEQTTTANQPTPEPTGLDGAASVLFVKANTDWLEIDSLASALAGTQTPFTFAVKGQIITTSSNGTILGGGRTTATGADTNMQLQYPHAGAATYRAYRDGDTGTADDRQTVSAVSGATRTHVFTFNGTIIGLRDDGTARSWVSTDWSTTACTFDLLTLGAFRNMSGVSNPWDGRIARVSLWPGVTLTDAQMADWEANA